MCTTHKGEVVNLECFWFSGQHFHLFINFALFVTMNLSFIFLHSGLVIALPHTDQTNLINCLQSHDFFVGLLFF